MEPSKKKGGGSDSLPPDAEDDLMDAAGDDLMDAAENALAADLLYSGLIAADVMIGDVITIRASTTIAEVSELFQIHNINGAPVVDDDGMLIGIVTEDDIVVGGMGLSDEELDGLDDEPAASEPAAETKSDPGPAKGDESKVEVRHVGEIMTPRPIAVEENTPIEELCNLMWNLKIHRIPIVSKGRVRGIVSTIDICRLVAQGQARIVPVD